MIHKRCFRKLYLKLTSVTPTFEIKLKKSSVYGQMDRQMNKLMFFIYLSFNINNSYEILKNRIPPLDKGTQISKSHYAKKRKGSI